MSYILVFLNTKIYCTNIIKIHQFRKKKVICYLCDQDPFLCYIFYDMFDIKGKMKPLLLNLISWLSKHVFELSFVKCAWTEFIMDLSLGSVFRKHSNNFCLRSWRSSIFVGRALTSVHMPHTCHVFSPFTRVAGLTL